MMVAPRINITIPTFNREASILRCLESSMYQNYANLTITIVDDASTDATFEKVEPFLEQDDTITYIKLRNNVGTANAKNVSVLLSDYDAITFHDSDDYFYRNKVSEQARAMYFEKPTYYDRLNYIQEHLLEHRSTFDVVTCACDFRDKFGNEHRLGEDRIVHLESFFPNMIRDYKTSNIWDWILINNALFSKRTFETLGGFVNNIEEDREIRNRFMLYGFWFNHIHEPLLKKIEDQPNLINGENTGRASTKRDEGLKYAYEKTKKMWYSEDPDQLREIAVEQVVIEDLDIDFIVNPGNLTLNGSIPMDDRTKNSMEKAVDRFLNDEMKKEWKNNGLKR